MDIKPTDPRNPLFDDLARRTELPDVRFKAPSPKAADPGAAAPPAGLPPGVTQADLRDAAKAEEILLSCFEDLVNKATGQVRGQISATQRRDLIEFLGNDPVMRGTLLKYLEQVVK